MATADTTARNSRAADFASDYDTAKLTILDGATTLVEHTLAGFGAPSAGVITASAISDENIIADGTADGATLSDTAGTYTLTVGLTGSGADVEVNTLTYITGQPSSLNSLAITFPA